jgi:dihydroorotate dehydrogenase electron transfer subunit
VSAGAATPFERGLLRVTANEQLGAYRVLRVAAPAAAPTPAAGQFAMIAAAQRWGGGEDERPYLPRAFSLLRVRAGEWQFMLEDVGPGTRRLCELEAGEGLLALGPLGNGFAHPPREVPAVLVGGGVGTAPLAILQDELAAAGAASVTVLLGFRDAAHARGAELLSGAQIATDDGSAGHHGLVTELLAAQLDRCPEAAVYACGPPAMLEAVRALCEQRGADAQLALEAGMACGFGACFGCVVPRRDGAYTRVCLDGPVLRASELAHVHAHGASASALAEGAAP